MKKSWIYIVLIGALAIGFFYIVLERPNPEVPVVDQSQGEADKDTPGEPGEESEEEPEVIPEDSGGSDSLPQDEINLEDKDNEPTDAPEVGKPLPDFTLKNLEGEDVTLSEIKDKIILVNFWASWCTWCDKEMPDMQRLQEENDDLMILAVNVEESREKAQEYITEGGYDFEVVLDENGDLAAQYLVAGLPGSYFVNKDGIFEGRVQGMMTYETMVNILNDIRSKE